MIFTKFLAACQFLRVPYLDAHPIRLSRSARKPQFWRVQGIEKSDEARVRQWIEEISPQYYSLAEYDGQSLCATVTTFEKPDKPQWAEIVEQGFQGITPLSSPDNAEVDIIAVTGLGGHALGSFRSSDGKYVWLRDDLPRSLPKARILTYGYDTTLRASRNKQSIRGLAKVFLDTVASFRRATDTQRRPVCLIGHSLGGVVLKEALAMSYDTNDIECRAMILCTYGLILLGVPNLGLRHPQLETMVEGQPNQQFIRDLLVDEDESPSQYLSELTKKFGRVCSAIGPHFPIVSYYETKRTPTLEVSLSLPFRILLCLHTFIAYQRRDSRSGWPVCYDGYRTFCRAYRRYYPRRTSSAYGGFRPPRISTLRNSAGCQIFFTQGQA
jgi:hypothetical protein